MRIQLVNTFHNTSTITKVEPHLEADAKNENGYLPSLAYYAQEFGSPERKKLQRIQRRLCPHGKDCMCGATIRQNLI
jgi:hypothetical protein